MTSEIDWAALAVQVLLTALGALAAERVRVFRRRFVAVGVLFGFLSAMAQVFPVGEIGYYGVPISLCDASPIVASFFFGSTAGLVSGGIASVVRLFAAFGSAGLYAALCGAVATAVTTLFAVALGKWAFDGKRPPACTAVIAAAYGIILRHTVGALFGLGDLSRTLEVVVASFVPMTVGSGVAAGLAAFACGSGRSWWRWLFSSLNLQFVFIGLSVAATTVVIGLNAKNQGDAIVRHAVVDLVAEGEDQVRYMLHESAVNIVESLSGDRLPSRDKLVGIAKTFGIDNIVIADTNGIVAVSTDADLLPGQVLERDQGVLRMYQEMCGGNSPFVSERFKTYGDDVSDEYVKYFGVPLPQGGILRLGYLWSTFKKAFPRYFLPAIDGRNIGETGFYLVFDGSGRTALSIPDRPETKGLSFSEIGFRKKDLVRPYETVFHVRILGVLCRCVAFEPFGEYRVFAVLPLAETQGPALIIATVVALVLLAVCIVFRLVLLRFQQAQAKIDALRAEEERRRAADLALARAIQRAELRTDGTQGDGYRISSLMDAAREVGGDFYDYYELPDGRLVVTIADVSGKGVPAALFMMRARTTLKSCVYGKPSLADAVAEANARLSENNPAEMFVTAWVGVWDRRTERIDFVSAGHNPPLIRRRDGTVEWLQAPRAAALGVFEKARYRGAQAELGRGDRLFLYTDGVTEAMNVRGELFGNERLLSALASAASPLSAAVRKSVGEFAAGAEQADDITVLELEAVR